MLALAQFGRIQFDHFRLHVVAVNFVEIGYVFLFRQQPHLREQSRNETKAEIVDCYLQNFGGVAIAFEFVYSDVDVSRVVITIENIF